MHRSVRSTAHMLSTIATLLVGTTSPTSDISSPLKTCYDFVSPKAWPDVYEQLFITCRAGAACPVGRADGWGLGGFSDCYSQTWAVCIGNNGPYDNPIQCYVSVTTRSPSCWLFTDPARLTPLFQLVDRHDDCEPTTA